jgi:hypothetical protein
VVAAPDAQHLADVMGQTVMNAVYPLRSEIRTRKQPPRRGPLSGNRSDAVWRPSQSACRSRLRRLWQPALRRSSAWPSAFGLSTQSHKSAAEAASVVAPTIDDVSSAASARALRWQERPNLAGYVEDRYDDGDFHDPCAGFEGTRILHFAACRQYVTLSDLTFASCGDNGPGGYASAKSIRPDAAGWYVPRDATRFWDSASTSGVRMPAQLSTTCGGPASGCRGVRRCGA